MGFTRFVSDVVDSMAERLLLTTDGLEALKGELEVDMRDARLGCFTDNEAVIADCEKRISRVDRELARRGVVSSM